MSTKQKVELEQLSDLKNEVTFRVLKLTNRLEPEVGSVISRRDVKDLLDRWSKCTVVIVPSKNG
jgi:hypothetical protein